MVTATHPRQGKAAGYRLLRDEAGRGDIPGHLGPCAGRSVGWRLYVTAPLRHLRPALEPRKWWAGHPD
ncbi:hypothetical protein [Kitasatospora sp. NPDC048407]|uniref:hypothetical protein n=1 Tax=Kitasatospora sp. NPDC048407 TaxID=3364051 RepID=UPI00371CE772